MKKIKIYSYVIFIIILSTIIIMIYQNVNANINTNIVTNQKVESEIEYIENELLSIINMIQNIEVENSNVISQDMSEENQESESNNQEQMQKEQTNYKISEKESFEINWTVIEENIEELYVSIPTITLDLYGIHQNKEEILNYNRGIDKLVLLVQEKNDKAIIKQIIDIYQYMVSFYETIGNQDEKLKVNTKYEILKSAMMVDEEEWEKANEYITNSIKIYEEKLANPENEEYVKNETNKIYIMLNELKSSLELEDKILFYIKYENLLEEINNS